jgi:putative heme-binding domain-containing protein
MVHRLLSACLLLAPLALRAQVPPSEVDLAQGRRLFQSHCVSCHGPNGEGGRGATLAQPTLPRVAELATNPAPAGRGGRGGGGGGRGAAANTDSPTQTPYDRALQQVIRGGVAGTEMPSHRLQPEELRVLALFVKNLGQLAPETVPGDPVKGAELYKTKGQCATCHTLRGQGAAIGPDLTEIGRKRSALYLRKALAEPSADVPQSYNAYRGDISLPLNFLFIRAKTKDGKDVAGVRINEDTFSVQIRDLTGRIHSYFKSELTEFHKDYGQSPMPVYSGVFTPDEMTDVVAFLASLRGGTTK